MEKISYRLVQSSRKTIVIQIMPNGEVVVRAPRNLSAEAVSRFVWDKQHWIQKHLPRREDLPGKLTAAQLRSLADSAAAKLPERVAHFAPMVGVTWGRITIRSQRTRWGSCSGKGNLNFNCLLMLTPDDVIDYVVVHELCHRKEMNHSSAFWGEVERILPDYRERKRWLKENGQCLLARLG